MSYTVAFDDQRGWVAAVIEGDLVAEITRAAALEGLEVARQHDCHKFLVDMRRTIAKDSTGVTYDFMSTLGQLGFTSSDRIAILVQDDRDKHDFAETVAFNRGWDNIRYFNVPAAAERWLEQV